MCNAAHQGQQNGRGNDRILHGDAFLDGMEIAGKPGDEDEASASLTWCRRKPLTAGPDS